MNLAVGTLVRGVFLGTLDTSPASDDIVRYEDNAHDAVTAVTTAIVHRTDASAAGKQEVLRGIISGDAAALAEWFAQHKDSLYAFVYYRVGQDPDLAADATQATFADALGRLSEFDPDRGGMANWLRFLSRNIIRRLLTQHRRGVQLQMAWDRIDETLEQALRRIDSARLPEAVIEREETRELVGMALANLPPHYQEVLEAKYLDSQPLEAIAAARNTTTDGVKSMLRRARAAFRECFLAVARIEVSDV